MMPNSDSESDSAVASAVHALFTSEPALLDTIVSYIPVERTPEPPTCYAHGDHSPISLCPQSSAFSPCFTYSAANHKDVPVDSTLATIASLCRAFPSLGKRLAPQNESFWRSMVLRRFDFQVDPTKTFNVDDNDYDAYPQVPVNASAIRAAIAQWTIDHPTTNRHNGTILANDLAYWPAIGAYFRPAEFAFLSEIQRGTADMNSWPAHEDAFSLYRDLVLIQGRLSKFQDVLETWSDGNESVHPCLLSRVKEENGAVTNGGFELLRHCDFMPHLWDRHQHNRWTGLDVPLPEDKTDEDLNLEPWELRTEEDKAVFPRRYGDWRSFERLRRVVHESFVDWRRVHANWGANPSAEFYIGESKVSRRWLGFVGESSYCNYTPSESNRPPAIEEDTNSVPQSGSGRGRGGRAFAVDRAFRLG